MGRRFSLMMGIVLLASPAVPFARGQTEGGGPPATDAAPPGPPATHVAFPGDFLPVEDPADAGAKPKVVPKADPKKPAPGPTAKKSTATATAKAKASLEDRPVILPGPASKPATASTEQVPGEKSPIEAPLQAPAALPEPPGEVGGNSPLIDPAVARTDGPAKTPAGPGTDPGQPPPAPVPAAGGGAQIPTTAPAPTAGPGGDPVSDALSSDRIPLGKQSVAVTVDVQAPPSMNLNQPAILRIVVRNTGTSDAINVRVLDELPEGLEYQSSQPEAYTAKESLLSWSMNVLPGGSEKVIAVKVKPVKAGSFDHAATVLFQTASKSMTQVFKPRLKVDQTVSTTNVLKGQAVEFKIGVTNIGNGPAKNVTVRAKLSPGLRHGTGEKNDEQMLELTLPTLAPNQREELDALVVDAIQGGDQSCTVTALSPDVVPFVKEESESVKTVTVVQPLLHLSLAAPTQRFTDTVGTYEIKVDNPGTAPARKVRVVATLPVSGRLVEVPKGARYDDQTRRIQWSFDQIEPGGKPRTLGFAVRMGGVGYYEVLAEAHGDGGLEGRDAKHTDVVGMPDVNLVVSERLRVVDVGGKTTFQIRLRNYGTKEATNLKLRAVLSANLTAEGTDGVPPGITGMNPRENGQIDEHTVVFLDDQGGGIKKLGPQKDLVMGLTVKVNGPTPKVATCKVYLTHDDLTDPPLEDMARVKVVPVRQSESPSP